MSSPDSKDRSSPPGPAATPGDPGRPSAGENREAGVTNRRAAEEALRALSERHASLLAALPEIVMEVDTRKVYTWANRAGYEFFGPDVIGREAAYYFEGEQPTYAIVQPVFQGRDESVYVESWQRRRDGEKRLLAWWCRTLRDARGEVVGALSSARDITEPRRAEAALQASFAELHEAFRGAIRSLASAIEMRDPYTSGHQDRVTKIACAVAAEMGLPADRIEGLEVAGTVHDIGKLAIPAEILSKPSELTPLEYSLIKSHAETGHTILKPIRFAWPVAAIVLQHHERLDGSGYPEGLAGPEILLEARILAVADVIEAMSSHRPYRPALGVETALEEIVRRKGTLYDPEVVDACVRLFRQGRLTLD